MSTNTSLYMICNGVPQHIANSTKKAKAVFSCLYFRGAKRFTNHANGSIIVEFVDENSILIGHDDRSSISHFLDCTIKDKDLECQSNKDQSITYDFIHCDWYDSSQLQESFPDIMHKTTWLDITSPDIDYFQKADIMMNKNDRNDNHFDTDRLPTIELYFSSNATMSNNLVM